MYFVNISVVRNPASDSVPSFPALPHTNRLCPQEYYQGTLALTLDSYYWLLIMLALVELLTLIQLLLSLTPSGRQLQACVHCAQYAHAFAGIKQNHLTGRTLDDLPALSVQYSARRATLCRRALAHRFFVFISVQCAVLFFNVCVCCGNPRHRHHDPPESPFFALWEHTGTQMVKPTLVMSGKGGRWVGGLLQMAQRASPISLHERTHIHGEK